MATPSASAFARLLAAALTALLLTMSAAVTITSPAAAHAELRQASPGVGETVGGEFHQIAMLFIGLNPNAPQDAKLYDPAGNLIESSVVLEDQKIIIPIEPLTVPGQYTIEFAVNGIDGDFTEESFQFRYDPAADEPSGLTLAFAGDQGFDFINFGLLIAAAAIAAFLLHRFRTALKEHRAAQSLA